MSGNYYYWGRIATEAGPHTLDLRYDDGMYRWIATHEATGEEHDVELSADDKHEAVELVINGYQAEAWQLEVWSGRECIHQ
ncbi:MAG: hypothetical protein WC145_09430 [Aliarcobacter sp.]|mgnify:CR=1 FL=1|jgi:hypothetical protein